GAASASAAGCRQGRVPAWTLQVQGAIRTSSRRAPMALREPPASAGATSKIEQLRDLQEAGDLDRAESGYRDWLAAHPDDATAWQLHGVVAFQRGQFKLAVERLSRALQIRPDFPQALSNLGSVMLAMAQIQQAEKLFRMA